MPTNELEDRTELTSGNLADADLFLVNDASTGNTSKKIQASSISTYINGKVTSGSANELLTDDGAGGITSVSNILCSETVFRVGGSTQANIDIDSGGTTICRIGSGTGSGNRAVLCQEKYVDGVLGFAMFGRRGNGGAGMPAFFGGGGTTAWVKCNDNQVAVTTQLVLKSYTVATAPTGVTGGMIYVTDETGGAVPAFYDGTNWRRVTDRAVIA